LPVHVSKTLLEQGHLLEQVVDDEAVGRQQFDRSKVFASGFAEQPVAIRVVVAQDPPNSRLDRSDPALDFMTVT